MTFVIITGGIDLSVGSMLFLSSVVCAKVMESGYGLEVGLVAALGVSLLVGLINGVTISYFGYPPFVVTLAMMSIARSLGMVISSNKTIAKFGPDQVALFKIGGGSLDLYFIQIPMPVVITMVIAAIAGFVLLYSAYGK
jgi:ribose transport system permease protein